MSEKLIGITMKKLTLFLPIFFLVVISILYFSCKRDVPQPLSPLIKLSIVNIHPITGKTQIMDTIIGTGFDVDIKNDSVYFNGASGATISATSTRLIVKVPGGATTGNVSISVNGNSAKGPVFTVLDSNVINSLLITSISPTHGYPQSIDTLFGSGFNAAVNQNVVYFNGVSALILNASTNRLIVTVPVSNTGTIDIVANGHTFIGPVYTYDTTSTDSVIVSTLAGSGIIGEQDGIGTAASFSYIWDVAADYNGNVFVADGDNNLIRKITSDGTVTTIAGQGSQLAVYGPGTYFYYPEGVAVDNRDSVYVTNRLGNDIYVISGNTIRKFYSPTSSGTDSPNGSTLSNYLNQPIGIAVDNNYNVYVADYINNAIRKITPDGTIMTLAGAGSTHAGNDNGLGVAATFFQPWGVAVDNNGNLYVGDVGNDEIRKITPAGLVTTLAGNPNGGDADGMGTNASFGMPYGVTVDGNGNVYFADYVNNKIKKITPLGLVTTIAGTGAVGSQDGPGKKATFNHPVGISVDGSGNIYVADGLNYKVRKISIVH